jgi:hypothetical protein
MNTDSPRSNPKGNAFTNLVIPIGLFLIVLGILLYSIPKHP